MAPKPRKPENKKLPARWRLKHGAYYYRVPAGLESEWNDKTEYRLGRTMSEAYAAWAIRVRHIENIQSMTELLDRYAQETVPSKAPKTQESNLISLRRLRNVFGMIPVSSVKPRHVYLYRDKVTKRHGPASANRDLEVLSHSFSKAVEWGLVDRNPIKGQVRKNSIPRRDRYIEDWELEQALSVASPVLRSYITFKLLTGLRRGDILRLRVSNLNDTGISLETSKTGARLTIRWTDELRLAVDTILRVRPKDIVPWLFCTRNGDCYAKPDGSANGFDSLWQRFMDKVLAQTEVSKRFQEKDLRKKTASDMPLELARKSLGHASEVTTRRHYRLIGEIVSPHSVRKENK